MAILVRGRLHQLSIPPSSLGTFPPSSRFCASLMLARKSRSAGDRSPRVSCQYFLYSASAPAGASLYPHRITRPYRIALRDHPAQQSSRAYTSAGAASPEAPQGRRMRIPCGSAGRAPLWSGSSWRPQFRSFSDVRWKRPSGPKGNSALARSEMTSVAVWPCAAK